MTVARQLSILALTTIMLTMAACHPPGPVLDIGKTGQEAVLFDTIAMDPNHRHGVFVKQIDRLNPYAVQTAFSRVYGSSDRNSLAWIMPPGDHELSFNFHDSATIFGTTAKSSLTVTVNLAAGGLYVPAATIVADEVEWRLLNMRTDRVEHGPWHTKLVRGATFNLIPAAQPTWD